MGTTMSEWRGANPPSEVYGPTHQRAADKDQELPRILTKKELRLMVPYSPQHILRLENRGKFPKRVQLGARRVGWYLHEVRGWLQQRSRGSSSSFTTPRPPKSGAPS
jgi:prophage regulatory protein